MNNLKKLLNLKTLYWLIGLWCFYLLAYQFMPHPPQECIKLSLERLSLCIPKFYLTSSYNPDEVGKKSTAIYMDVPIPDLPISTALHKYDNVSIELLEGIRTFEQRRKAAFESYEFAFKPTHTLKDVENGMNILSATPERLTFWTGQILFPANGDPVYFECGTNWTTQWGTEMEANCHARVDWDKVSAPPYIELQFLIPRKDLGQEGVPNFV